MTTVGQDDISIGEKTYTFVKSLSGRGQSGAAGFYNIGEKQWLIKEDDPATCLAEGLAIIPKLFEPFTPPIIQAETNQKKISEQKTVTVSIQPAFTVEKEQEEQMMGLDVAILGRKRDPKTLISEEGKNKAKIKEAISKMSSDVKDQLARAIVTSQVNGDESLHTGQFMVSKKGDIITKIQRVDMGALGRFALANQNHSPLQTSKNYRTSGQFEKDYVKYLVENTDVREKVLKYWSQIDVDIVVKQITERFDNQMKNLTDITLKKTALKGFYNTLNKNNKKNKDAQPPDEDLGKLETQVKTLLEQSANKRCQTMKANAVLIQKMDSIKKELNSIDKSQLTPIEKKYLNKCLSILSKDNMEGQKEANKLISYINKITLPEKSLLNNIIDSIKNLFGSGKNKQNLAAPQLQTIGSVSPGPNGNTNTSDFKNRLKQFKEAIETTSKTVQNSTPQETSLSNK